MKHPTFAHIPPGPLAGPLQLVPLNAAVVSVHTVDLSLIHISEPTRPY